jgi:hypothetical protein
VPQLSQLVAITGITNPICTVAAAPAQATGTLSITSSTVILTMAAQLSATGWLSGAISPYTPLSPESLAAKVEESLAPRLDNIEQRLHKVEIREPFKATDLLPWLYGLLILGSVLLGKMSVLDALGLIRSQH